MKIKPNHKLSILVFILSFSLYFGQKVEFNVPKDIETLQNSIFDFKNNNTISIPPILFGRQSYHIFYKRVDLIKNVVYFNILIINEFIE